MEKLLNDTMFQTITDDNSIILEKCTVNMESLSAECEVLVIPEGINAIGEHAFDDYNISFTESKAAKAIELTDLVMNEWMKRLNRRSIYRYHFPEGVTSTLQKAEYMVEKETAQRLLELHLPGSVETINPKAFPVLLDKIHIDESNQHYRSVDGVVFSKDMKTLLRFPGHIRGNSYTVPEGVEVIAADAFYNAYLERLFLPKTIRKIENYAFRSMAGLKEFLCESDEVTLGAGIFANGRYEDISWWCFASIPKAAFINSNIRTIAVPEGVSAICDYAFAGCYRTKTVTIPETVVSIGERSFEMGATCSGTVQLPSALYKYILRFPIYAQINGMRKDELIRENKGLICERRSVIREQIEALKNREEKLNFLDKKEKKFIQDILSSLQLCDFSEEDSIIVQQHP